MAPQMRPPGGRRCRTLVAAAALHCGLVWAGGEASSASRAATQAEEGLRRALGDAADGLPGDDECRAAGDDEQGAKCGVSALQYRGLKVASTRGRTADDPKVDCDAYMEQKGCDWTRLFNCPGQPDGKQGKAKDDGSPGFECCCTQGLAMGKALPPRPTQAAKVSCDAYMRDTGCAWTGQFSCPGQPDGKKGKAKDDGSMGFECCCAQGLAGQADAKPANVTTAAPVVKTVADPFEQCSGEGWTGPSKCVEGYHCFANTIYYGQCVEGKPKPFATFNATEELQSVSEAPLMTFYMYRATNNNNYALANVNAGTLGGMLWYVHNEVVSCIYKDCDWARRFGIDRIRRYKVQTRAPQPLYAAGLNFGLRYAFDMGQCTGPWDCNEQFEDKGYFVGCNSLSAGFPFPTWPVYYNGSWFSLPGACSELRFNEQSLECKKAQPGGLCKGPPTGNGTCTYSYQEAGVITLNELENITDYRAFKQDGGIEWDPETDEGVNMTFWDGINNTEANARRVQFAADLFKQKYPDMPHEQELPPPDCDFNITKFFPYGLPTKLNANAPELRSGKKR